MQFIGTLVVLFSLCVLCILAEGVSAPVSSTESFFSDIQTVTIYDSLSVLFPHELRERGVATYSPSDETGTFTESGVTPRPHEGAETIYRIGTESHMGIFLDPGTVATGDVPINEILTLFLDMNDALYHVGYTMTRADAAAQPAGSMTLKIDHMRNSRGPEVPIIKKSKTKTQNQGGPAASVVVGQAEGEEEELPEKTFIQKYWIYAVPLVLLLVLGGGNEQS